jgi:uncharacterized membrane protein YhaH (DUF805 family)
MSDVFKGRIGRDRYWRLTVLCGLASIVALFFVAITANQTSRSPVNVLAAVVAIAGVFIFVAACVALFVVGIWRLHDRGKSGFWIILYYPVPLILALLAIHPDRQGTVPECIALAILVWAIIDLGILEGKPVGSVAA